MIINGLNENTVQTLLASWRDGTKNNYRPFLNQWLEFCSEKSISPLSPPLQYPLNFLQILYDKGKTFSQINTACSALSVIINYGNPTFGKIPAVKRFMKGVFELRPTFPKHFYIWDVNKVFQYFRSLPNLEDLSLKQITLKLVVLLTLLSGGQRCQTLHSICIDSLKVINNTLHITINKKLKQTRPGKHMKPLVFKAYPLEKKLCVLSHINIYLEKTEVLRQNTKQLFVSHIRPHKAVSRDTISRWVKEVLQSSGIDTSIFTPHSCRSAASSKCKSSGFSLKTIIDNAG